MPASNSEQVCVELLVEDRNSSGQPERLELVLVDRGTSATAARRLAKSFENTTRSATGWLQLACVAAALEAIS